MVCLLCNLIILVASWLGLVHFSEGLGVGRQFLTWFTMCVFLSSLVTFLLSIFVEPGYIQPKYDFIWLVDQFLEQNIHLDNLCVFDEIIKSENSFHCTICNRCSDNYDHHCPFIDNCLGTKNHKYFLLFLASYFTYSLLVVLCAIWKFVEFSRNIETRRNSDMYWTSILFGLIVLPMPVLVFQFIEQLKNLNKPP